MNWLTTNISDLVNLLFPKLCITCGERLISQEEFLCFNCWHDLPVTNFQTKRENKVAQLFWGRVQIENATSFFFYKKGSRYPQLIHYIKYKGLKELGFETGRRFGSLLSQSDNFNGIDVVVPVPLHPRKKRKRGFNQSDWIAGGVAEALQKPVETKNLFRKTFTATQTRKNRFERWQNVEGIFGLKYPEKFENKHVLLIDDVVTTGATIEACTFQLLKAENTKVSVATLAFADY